MWKKREEPKPPVSPQYSTPLPHAPAYTPPVHTPPTFNSPLPHQPAAAPPVAQKPPAHVPSVAPEPVREAVRPPQTVLRPQETAASVITKGIVISGEILGGEDLQIDGEVRGTVLVPDARVVVTTEGKASGSIEAREVVMRGKLKGNLRATDRVLVGQTGFWQGDSISPRLVIEEGAVVRGKFEVAQPGPKKNAGRNGKPAEPVTEEHLAIRVSESNN
jgi:cytoskeletal protein CcmA (bactofilin family)